MDTTTEWKPQPPQHFVDKRFQMRRDGPARTLHVRAFRAVVLRRGADGKPERETCPHAHAKASAARKCAEAAARRLNR